jgi:hypothetical protein
MLFIKAFFKIKLMKITGNICYGDNLTKIPNGMVCIVKEYSGQPPSYVQADENGNYEIDNLTPGYYLITGVCGSQKFDYVKPVQSDVDFINSVIAGTTPFPTDKAVIIAGRQDGNINATEFLQIDAQWITDLMNGVIVIVCTPQNKQGLRFECQSVELVDSDMTGVSIRASFFGDVTLKAFQQGFNAPQVALYQSIYPQIYAQVSEGTLSGTEASAVLDAVKQKVI